MTFFYLAQIERALYKGIKLFFFLIQTRVSTASFLHNAIWIGTIAPFWKMHEWHILLVLSDFNMTIEVYGQLHLVIRLTRYIFDNIIFYFRAILLNIYAVDVSIQKLWHEINN